MPGEIVCLLRVVNERWKLEVEVEVIKGGSRLVEVHN